LYPGSYVEPERLLFAFLACALRCYLNELADNATADPIVRELLNRSSQRLQTLCTNLLHRGYPRLARPPLNLLPDEWLSGAVERLPKALREIRPRTVRQFFALANQHMRWELNDLARRSDRERSALEQQEGYLVAPG
jgi:RNA polymerase sigma-70 factor (ECF subfamily)